MKIEIAIFAKAPVPGYSKTRLIPALGRDGAALLQQQMTSHIVEQAVHSGVGVVTLYGTPNCSDHSFKQLQADYHLTCNSQRGDGLGERMSAAISSGLNEHDAVILVGSDCPQLDKAVLLRVESELQISDVVIVPASDGGYVLIAMRQSVQPHLATIFGDIEWGGNQVMAQTEARLSESGVRWQQLPALRDIDREEDLEYLPSYITI